MARRTKGSIERVAVVKLGPTVERCAAELKRCIRATTCARRLALIGIKQPVDPSLRAGFRADDCTMFLRASDHLDREGKL